ncbi:unnamed protein product [Allacma fusca]|uniref:Lipocalin/cytosolic fatty-acid binding domain-containing protein n=1 Tax=Allacma fusca TaxID=39272 RepID=A0A8J2LA40_9HEXA|nr:unnamed protein product [Allacma fusca]
MKLIKVYCSVVFTLSCLYSGARGARSCGRFPPLFGFQVDRYLGRWWQLEKTMNYREMMTGKCYSINYSRDPMSVNKLKMRTDYVTRVSNSPNTMFSTLAMVSPQFDPSHFRYAMSAMPWMKKNYRVIATDYENFSIEYMCNTNMLGNAEESVWLLTRERHPSEAVRLQAKQILQVLGFEKLKLYDADQSCKEKPMRMQDQSMLEWLFSV